MEIERFDTPSLNLRLLPGMENQFYVTSLPAAASFAVPGDSPEQQEDGSALHFILVNNERVYYDLCTEENRSCRYTLRLLHLVRLAAQKQWKVLPWYNCGAAHVPPGEVFLFAPKFLAATDTRHDYYWFRRSCSDLPITDQAAAPAAIPKNASNMFQTQWNRWSEYSSSNLELEYRGPQTSWREDPPSDVPRHLIQTQESYRWKFNVDTQELVRSDRKIKRQMHGNMHLSSEILHSKPPPNKQQNPLGRVKPATVATPLTIFYPPLPEAAVPDLTRMTMTPCGLTRSDDLWPEFAFQCPPVESPVSSRLLLVNPGDRVQARQERATHSSYVRHDRTWGWHLGPHNHGAGPLGVDDPDLYRCYRDECEFTPEPLVEREEMKLIFLATRSPEDGAAQLYSPTWWKLHEQQMFHPQHRDQLPLQLKQQLQKLLHVSDYFDTFNCTRVYTSQGDTLILERVVDGFLLYEQRVPTTWGVAYGRRYASVDHLTFTEKRLNKKCLQFVSSTVGDHYWTDNENSCVWVLRRWSTEEDSDVSMVGTLSVTTEDQVNLDLTPFFKDLQQAIGSLSAAAPGTS